jgi:predicted ATPase/class 3 adenylate cyclase
MVDIEELEAAIAALESQRATLGDAVVDAGLAPMREKLAKLKSGSDAPDQQRKLVTVLFADIVGSTKMGLNRDPEEILEIMDGALRRLALPVKEHGGHVTRYMGDGFKAIFGLPVAYENDAKEAVRAGLGILEMARSYAEELELKHHIMGFNIRVGINTGLVATGGYSEAEDTIMGLTVNLGARLESAAPPGGLLISHYTYQHVRGIFDVEPVQPIDAKGFPKPVPAYLVKRAMPSTFHTITRGVRGVQTPTVGRDAELNQLQDLFRVMVSDEQTHVLNIVGEPGVGKSRLLDEFVQWVDTQSPPVVTFKGRARQQLMGTPHGLLRDLFAYHFDILESDPVEVAGNKLESSLVDYFAEEPQMKTHFIGALLGFDFSESPHLRGVQNDPEQLRDRALFYLAQFFRAVAKKTPTLILLEDIHWADASSLDAISGLAEDCPNLRLMFLCLTRKDTLESHSQVSREAGKGKTVRVTLNIKPLSKPACLKLADEILQNIETLPETLRERIVSSSEGNPFYLEELVNVLIDDGIILEDSTGAWRISTANLDKLNVPPTLTAVVQARLDSLPLAEKVVLQQAAVVGRIFWDALLQALQGTDKSPTPELGALTHRELISKELDSAFSGTNEFVFNHTMVRDVAYETVLKRVRQAFHAQTADWLVSRTRSSNRVDEYSVSIAEHYELAGESSEAAIWYLRAGERANTQGALLEAHKLFDRTLELLPENDLDRRWRALIGRDSILGILGETEARMANDVALVKLAEELKDDERLADAYVRQGYFTSVTGDHHKALRIYQAALDSARRAKNLKLEALTLSLMVESQIRSGMMEQAERSADDALRLAQELEDDSRTQAMILNNVGLFHTENGDIAQAAHLHNHQLEICRRTGNRLGEAIGLFNLGYDYIPMGLYAEGQEILEHSLHLFESIGARRWTAWAKLNLGIANLRNKDIDAAQRFLEGASQLVLEIEDTTAQAVSQSYLALTAEKAGDYSQAKRRFVESNRMFNAIDNTGFATDTLAGIARCALGEGDLDEATGYAARVWNYLQDHGPRGMEFPVLAYQTCAQIFEATGEPQKAQTAVESGYEELMQRADKISDPNWRRSFLENVPEHRHIIEIRERMSV